MGLGKACEVAGQLLDAEATRLTGLRERLWAGIRARLTDVHLNGHATRRLPGTLHVRLDGVDAQAMLAAIRDVALSATSACSSGSGEPSHVLRALGLRRGSPCRASGSALAGGPPRQRWITSATDWQKR